MAQDNSRRKKRFTSFRKTNPEANQSSDLPPPPSQCRRGCFALLRSKSKGLFTRRARHPNTSQLVSPMTDVRQDSAQLVVPEEVVNKLPNMSSNHPSVSLNDPYDGSYNDPTSDQHAQRQSDMLPTTDQSTHEGQTAHGAELNDFATSLTDKPGLDEANEARRDAREAVSSLKSVSGPVQTALSGINDAGHLVAAVDHIIPLLGNLSKFNSLVDTIAEIHPYAKAACGVLSVVSKTITLQATRDDSISQLLSKMDEVYIFLTENDLAALTSMKSVVVRICQQTLECSYFLRDYSKSKNFWIRLGRNVVSETDGRVKGYNTVFDDLMQQFRDRAARDTVVVVHRIKLEGIQELGVSLTLTQPMTQHMTQSLRRLT